MALPVSVRANSDVVSQQVGDEVVLLNLKTGVYWGLNPTGATIWGEIVEHGDVRRILERLREQYEATDDQLVTAISELLTHLSKEGLVVLDDAA